jgi:hypothetical protein
VAAKARSSYSHGRGRRSAELHFALIALLTALQLALIALAGGPNYGHAQPQGFVWAAMAFALYRFANGSRVAWTAFIAFNTVPLMLAALMTLASHDAREPRHRKNGARRGHTRVATSPPMLILLLAMPVRRYIALATARRSASSGSGAMP